MAHISSIGAGLFSDLSIHVPATLLTSGALSALTTAGAFNALFTTAIESGQTTSTGTSTFIRVRNVREYPQIGTPANVVNVPAYGQKTSSQIQGQADAPSLEVTLNFVPSDWADGTLLGDLVGNGSQYVFRFAMLNSEPTGTTVATKYASSVAGLGSVQNSVYYWVGKVEALLANPQLTDANQATMTMTLQGEFYGAYTL